MLQTKTSVTVDLSPLTPELQKLVKAVLYHQDCPQELIDSMDEGIWLVRWRSFNWAQMNEWNANPPR